MRTVILLAVLALASCGSKKDPVTVIGSRLIYHTGGRMDFGSGNAFSVRVDLKLDSQNESVAVTFIADGARLETTKSTILTGTSDTFDVSCRDKAFTHGGHREIEVLIQAQDGTLSGPFLLQVPKPEL